MFRGLGKFVAVAVVAALVGAGIGVGLAALTDSGDEPTASVPATTTAAPAPATATQTQPAAPPPPPPAETQTQTATEPATTTTATPAKLVGPVPKVTIASATLGQPSTATGHARVTVKVTVTNRYSAALPSGTPALVSDSDEVSLDSEAKDAAAPLLKSLEPKASATGELRFTLPTAVAQRLQATPTAKLRIAGRTVALKLTPAG
jgi:hypothetical protein